MKAFSSARQTAYWVALAACIAALIYKFFWSYFHFGIPLGYDVGMYRYLFLKHGVAFPPFVLGDVQDWAKDHPLGLFILTTPLIKLGLPVDWLIGWMWNAFSVLLVLTLAWATATSKVFTQGLAKNTKIIFLTTVAVGTLSLPLYDGFVAMYWKTFASLFFVVLSFALLERKSYWAVLAALFALTTHNQTGLLFALSVGLWWVITNVYQWKNPRTYLPVGIACGVGVLAFFLYLPVFNETLGKHILPFLTTRGSETTAGAFPSLLYYLPRYSISLTLAFFGFVLSLKRKQFSLWHAAVFWSALFVFSQVFFYRRFILHLDFFLLPFSGYFLFEVAKRWNKTYMHVIIILILCVQGYFVWNMMHERWPLLSSETYEAVQNLPAVVPENATVISFENITPLWLRGWLPDHRVVGPGFFEPYGKGLRDWDAFLEGDNRYRKIVIGGKEAPLFFFLPREFSQVHGEKAQGLLHDPCIEPVKEIPSLYVSLCSYTK